MIEHILIDGYKCLKKANLAAGNLNILVGPNASGKSSVLQALLLLRQSADKDGNVDGLHLSGSLYEAGTAQDVLHPVAEHQIKLALQTDNKLMEFLFRHIRDDTARTPKRLLPIDTKQRLPDVLYDRNDGFAYLNAERLGPRVTYALPPDELHLGGLTGKQGEYTTAVLARAASNEEVPIDNWNEDFVMRLANAPKDLDGLELRQDLEKTQGRLDLVCNQMLGWVLPGAVFDAQEHDQSDAASLRFIRDPLATKALVRAIHVDFGLAYTLPIITAALALRRNGLLLVENPEAHLHPFSQSRIGVFLAVMAAAGRQIFLETHSDHVVNGIRLAVRYKLIPADQVHINFFNRPVDRDTATITPIRSQPNGRLKPWPPGFFDQLENDLSKL
ncbi:MAG: DUF3696 domain-containing protein [Gammaproteobacteria bacterium]|nr:DUF3696 domain-containing protein [Gammaproteobacteria bacterium]